MTQTTTRAEFFLYQNGMVVANAEGPKKQIIEEAWRYLAQYLQDGPCELRIIVLS